jgi:uncharacterized peroxidase-related enzyme
VDRPDWIRTLVRDWRAADLSLADRAMLAYAEKLTRAPWAVVRADVDALRVAGFDDAAILDVCQVAGYMSFVNRMADGLGVELEAGWAREEFDATEALPPLP